MYRQSPTELKLTISTMKIILFFALFGLSFCQDTDCPITNPKADDPNCLAQALKDIGYFSPAVANFFCAYYKFKEDQNTENYNIAAHIFIKALNCTGCHLQKFFGTGYNIQSILVSAGQSVQEALKAVIEVLKLLQIDETTARTLCLAAGDILQSPCLKDALANIAPDILLHLKELYCKIECKNQVHYNGLVYFQCSNEESCIVCNPLELKNPNDADAAAAAAAGVSKLLGALGCALQNQLGFNAGELENALRTLSREDLQRLVEKILLLTGQFNVINDIACFAINPVPAVPGI